MPCLYRSDFQITIPTFLAGESSWLYYHQKRFTSRVQLPLFFDPSLPMTGAPRGWVFGAILVCLVVSCSGTAQTNSTATKLDEFWDLTTDDAQAHLDRFAQVLAKDSKVRGVIVAYRSQDTFVGSHLRLLFGYHDYLVNSRGIASEQLRVVDGGARDKPKIELWLVPDGAGFSAAAPSVTVETRLASLSGPHSIQTVRLKDIDVYLNRHEKTIDLTISVRPRSKARR
jgi:hypothetical protein